MGADLSDLYWAQENAARNRAVMTALFCEVVGRAFAERGHSRWSSSPSRQARAYRDPATGAVLDLVVPRKARSVQARVSTA
ncbi:hypothetical protein SFC88_14445 [Nocardioides sp. HM23]|uniref:hypothetical protein n=1 Tax=Nocardioides bizhenqiangii TaxID=3095076 RepID=UPI002ACA1725|nr:hypothetical protein [Nocardioides sp. HM23]MDZ5622044.1 hypothetical protein [Nocardioides sp. HM23]